MVDRLCTSLGGLSLSAIRRYTALAAEREDCIVLTIGEPDLPTPAAICEAAVRRAVGDKPLYTLRRRLSRAVHASLSGPCGPARPAGATFDRPELFKAVGDDGLAHRISHGQCAGHPKAQTGKKNLTTYRNRR